MKSTSWFAERCRVVFPFALDTMLSSRPISRAETASIPPSSMRVFASLMMESTVAWSYSRCADMAFVTASSRSLLVFGTFFVAAFFSWASLMRAAFASASRVSVPLSALSARLSPAYSPTFRRTFILTLAASDTWSLLL